MIHWRLIIFTVESAAVMQCHKIFLDFLSIMKRCNYFHCCTGVFDEPEGITFREGGHFIWRFFRNIFKPTEGNTSAVHHQL